MAYNFAILCLNFVFYIESNIFYYSIYLLSSGYLLKLCIARLFNVMNKFYGFWFEIFVFNGFNGLKVFIVFY